MEFQAAFLDLDNPTTQTLIHNIEDDTEVQ